MSEVIAQLNVASGGDTFTISYDRINDVINAVSTVVCTVNTHANGGLTTGNGYVEGIFGARNLVGNTISGGTVETPGLLTILTDTEFTGDTITMGDVVINTSGVAVNGALVITSSAGYSFSDDTIGTSTQEVDNFDKITLRGAEYVIAVKDTNANAYQISKLLLVHDSGNAFMTQYSVIYSNTEIGVFSANANSTHCRVYLTPTIANTHVTGSRVTVEV